MGQTQTDNGADPMASTRIKKLARALQRANPGMKYTEALRRVEEGSGADELADPGRAALEAWFAAGGRLSDATLARMQNLPPGVFDPFRSLEERRAHAQPPSTVELDEAYDLTAPRGKTTAKGADLQRVPTSRLGKVGSIQTDEGAVLYRSEELDPLSLRIGGNMLLVAPHGTGGEGLVRAIAGTVGSASEVNVVIPGDSARPGMQSDWHWATTICEDTSTDAVAKIATPALTGSPGNVAIFLEEPERFEEPGTWWDAIAPRLGEPNTAVIVRTASVHTVPAELSESFAVKAIMGHASTDPDEAQRTVGEVPAREREWSEFGKAGTGLVRQDGEVTGFTVGG